MRMWRNWQTRKIQVLMVARLCRFKSCHPHQYGASLKTGTKRRDTESLFFIPENACALSAVEEYRNSDARTRRYRLLAKPSRCSLQVLSSAPKQTEIEPYISICKRCSGFYLCKVRKKHKVQCLVLFLSPTQECPPFCAAKTDNRPHRQSVLNLLLFLLISP